MTKRQTKKITINTKALIAECIATFTLTFVGVGAIVGNVLNNGETGLVGIALAHGLAIAVMVAATASISGAHINPAVTIGLFFTKKIDAENAIAYILVQCLGATIAAALIKACWPLDAVMAVGVGTPAPGPGVTVGMALLTEIILTFLLVFVIYATAVTGKVSTTGAALFIGLTIVLDILAGGPISGAAMNPARYLGPALMGGGLENVWLYWLGPVTGGILGAVTYQKFLE